MNVDFLQKDPTHRHAVVRLCRIVSPDFRLHFLCLGRSSSVSKISEKTDLHFPKHCYVDDLLLIIPKEKDIDLVFDQTGKSVTLKKTGLVGTSSKGGNLCFLGRVVSRQLGESSVQVS